MGTPPPVDVFAPLYGSKTINLTTFKKGGVPVATPVWFVPLGGRLYVRTGRTTGKVKRIRHDPVVTVAPCTSEGRVTGPPLPGIARVLPPDEADAPRRAWARRYRLERGLLGVARAVLRRPEDDVVFIEIRPV
jgi:PPOX class probable F420-dependent enzyme